MIFEEKTGPLPVTTGMVEDAYRKVSSNGGSARHKLGEGTPQGGVISPLLASLYLHYTFDKWFDIHFSGLTFVSYADDIVIHCKTERQSYYVLDKVRARL